MGIFRVAVNAEGWQTKISLDSSPRFHARGFPCQRGSLFLSGDASRFLVLLGRHGVGANEDQEPGWSCFLLTPDPPLSCYKTLVLLHSSYAAQQSLINSSPSVGLQSSTMAPAATKSQWISTLFGPSGTFSAGGGEGKAQAGSFSGGWFGQKEKGEESKEENNKSGLEANGNNLQQRQQKLRRPRFAVELDGLHCFETIVPQ
ncbi:hypothetical protein Cni_G25560 [Canna indica]|uniref:Uncharacterized protein n=1 Tax=Canna indica TaxID=4628 RepID=A0AAQ3L4J0_9LILI|nr:hypothetical protein Cni_G25560 [Canna indica]